MDIREEIKLLYCKWCPNNGDVLTDEEKSACLANGGFAEDLENIKVGQYTVGQVLEFASKMKEGEKLAIVKLDLPYVVEEVLNA